MRKLPPDSEVCALKASGLTAREIAERYGVFYPAVHTAIRRHEGRLRKTGKKQAADISFTKAGATPVEHRDTGDGIGFGKILSLSKLRHTSLDDCRDLLREWRVGA